MDKIGLIAGNRRFPVLFCEAAKKRGCHIVAVAIKGDTSYKIKKCADKVYWIGLDEFSRLFGIFREEGVTRVAMAGQINPRRLFSRQIDKDPELKDLLSTIKDKRADTIFGAMADKLSASGLELIDSTTFIGDLLPAKGTLTARAPDFKEWEDVYFGLELAKAVAFLDIGQTVAVKDKAIVAVEALEGTDNLIRRSGRIARNNFTIVKVSKPKQDLRFDMPVVGLNTVKNLIKAGASCLAIEAGKTIFIDRKESVSLADRGGISIVAV